MNKLLNTRQTAQILGVKPQTLRIWRYRKKGPPYVRYGSDRGPAYYNESDIEKWVQEHTYTSTSDETVRKSKFSTKNYSTTGEKR
jgi:predicted DNA-binding transcriptional regulator AlpA